MGPSGPVPVLTAGLVYAAAEWAHTGPQVSTVVFTRSRFFIKSAFRNVYSLIHVCFHLLCAPQQEGVCTGSRRVEKVQDEFPEQIRGRSSLINYLLYCTLKH